MSAARRAMARLPIIPSIIIVTTVVVAMGQAVLGGPLAPALIVVLGVALIAVGFGRDHDRGSPVRSLSRGWLLGLALVAAALTLGLMFETIVRITSGQPVSAAVTAIITLGCARAAWIWSRSSRIT